MNMSEASRFILKVPAGEKCVYHTGLLAKDRSRPAGEVSEILEKEEPWKTVGQIGKLFQEAYRAGLVTLVQRKLGDMMYEYMAIKRKA